MILLVEETGLGSIYAKFEGQDENEKTFPASDVFSSSITIYLGALPVANDLRY